VREAVLKFPEFVIKPALAATMTRQVRFKKRLRKHFGAALITLRRSEVLVAD
jgi:hypothetical protein